MRYKSIEYINNLLRISEYDQETQNIVISKLNEMLAIAQAIPQMKAKSMSFFDRSPQWDPQRVGEAMIIVIENLRNHVINYMEHSEDLQQDHSKEEMDIAVNDFNTTLFEFEKELSALPYDVISDVSQALSSIRLIFNDFIYPTLQEQVTEKQIEQGIDEYIAEIDPNLRHHLERLSIQPPAYSYKGHEIRVKKDKQNRPYFQLAKTDITSRSLKSIVNYIESMEESK